MRGAAGRQTNFALLSSSALARTSVTAPAASTAGTYVAIAFYRRPVPRDEDVEAGNGNGGGGGGLGGPDDVRQLGVLARIERWLIYRVMSGHTFTHCEIFIPLPTTAAAASSGNNNNGLPVLADDDYVMAYGVFAEKGVFKMRRRLANPAYECVFLTATAAEVRALQRFVADQHGKPMSQWNARMSVLWPLPSDERSWFCAEFTVAALQRSLGMMQTFMPGAVRIDELYALVVKSERRFMNETPHDVRAALLSPMISAPGPRPSNGRGGGARGGVFAAGSASLAVMARGQTCVPGAGGAAAGTAGIARGSSGGRKQRTNR